MSDSIPPAIDAVISESIPAATAPVAAIPMYRVNEQYRVPVSSHNGPLWESRIKSAEKARKNHVEAADEAVRYYNHNQSVHRNGEGPDIAANRYFSAARNNQLSETENIVYANVRAVMPMLYAKNPKVELTTRREMWKAPVKAAESLVNTLASIKHAPGLNLAVHGRQAVLATELMNVSWLEYGYTERTKSSEAVGATLQELADELANAKDQNAIREIEGKIMALEEELDLYTASGPFVKYRSMHEVVVDSECTLPDFSDRKWLASKEYYPTAYLNAKYREKDSEGQWRSVYMPTDVIVGDTSDDSLATFKLFDRNEDARAYGYDNDEQLRKAQRTMCWRIYDRITRRVYLYASNRWEWPIWAESDPYGLPNFDPFYPLYFNNSPMSAYARSNVTYYLDQQDALNEIHDEMRRARQSVREGILYDSELGRDTLEKLFKAGTETEFAFGIKVPEGKTLAQCIFPKPNLMLQAMPLFDPTRLMQSIDRVSGVSEMLRGAQLKTNTTKYAAESYNSTSSMRLDEKIDAVETTLGQVLHGVAFLCMQFMEQDTVASIIGDEQAAAWQNYPAAELRRMFTCETVGSSMQKPTSPVKQQQAMEMAQVLQPFAQYAPSVVLELVLGAFNEAFDSAVLPADAFLRILKETQMTMQQGNNAPGAAGGAPTGGAAAPPSPQSGGADASVPPAPSMEQLAALIERLPPELKQVLATVMERGVPLEEAIPEMLAMAEQMNGAVQ